MDFPGVALVTGASSGIGKATSVLFGAEGCKRIIIADIDSQGLDKTRSLISERYPTSECCAIQVDLRDERSVEHLIWQAASKWGRLDYCCNVAGIVLEGGTANGSTADWNLLYEVNLRGAFFCERAELRKMLEQEPLTCKDSKYAMKGSIVNVSSLAGLIGFPDLPAYTAMKHGVAGLTKSDAMKYGMEGIRINAICPGRVATPIAKALKPKTPEEAAELLKVISLGRVADPDEIAQAIVWLSSGRASYVNGIMMSVDGGQGGSS